jgi:hypothetical protein
MGAIFDKQAMIFFDRNISTLEDKISELQKELAVWRKAKDAMFKWQADVDAEDVVVESLNVKSVELPVEEKPKTLSAAIRASLKGGRKLSSAGITEWVKDVYDPEADKDSIRSILSVGKKKGKFDKKDGLWFLTTKEV